MPTLTSYQVLYSIMMVVYPAMTSWSIAHLLTIPKPAVACTFLDLFFSWSIVRGFIPPVPIVHPPLPCPTKHSLRPILETHGIHRQSDPRFSLDWLSFRPLDKPHLHQRMVMYTTFSVFPPLPLALHQGHRPPSRPSHTHTHTIPYKTPTNQPVHFSLLGPLDN